MKKNAFTMSEALIVLGIVAVLAALSVIALKNSKPDVDMVLYRHSYSKVRKVVSELLNDTELYPFVTNESATKKASSGDKLSQYNIIELGLGLRDTSINVDALKNSGIDLNGEQIQQEQKLMQHLVMRVLKQQSVHILLSEAHITKTINGLKKQLQEMKLKIHM